MARVRPRATSTTAVFLLSVLAFLTSAVWEITATGACMLRDLSYHEQDDYTFCLRTWVCVRVCVCVCVCVQNGAKAPRGLAIVFTAAHTAAKGNLTITPSHKVPTRLL